MMPDGHRLSALAEAAGGAVHAPLGDERIAHLAIDSRKALPLADLLFIALRGDRHDGHRYIQDLIERGVRNFLVSAPLSAELRSRANTITVPDTLDALQRIVAWHRGHFHGPVIGITGSNGKTVVKEWLAQLMREEELIARSPGSWNSQVGVPLSVWELSSTHTLGIFEAGISKPGEMARLRPIIRPTIGIFTNIGPAHGENFPNDQAKASEKLELFREVRTLVYCADHATVQHAIKERGLDQHVELCGWSREGSSYVHVLREERVAEGTRIQLLQADRHIAFSIPFDDQASVENALHCATLLLRLGWPPERLVDRMPHLAPVSMRLQLLEGVQNSLLINDAYSNDTASLAIALDHLVAHAADRERVVVLSDIHESGEAADRLYDRVAQMLRRAHVARLYGVGPIISAHADRFGAGGRFFADTDALLEGVAPDELRGAALLVKGARAFGLERAVERWQQQAHGPVLEIDLEAIRHNLNYYRSALTPFPSPTERGGAGVGIIAMVKAFGYGSGATELARLFAFERVDMLGVAYADEGITLRQDGVRMPILVMNPEPVPFDLLHRFRLEAVVYDTRSLEAAIAHARMHSDAPPVHLKIDTGMHRLGFDADVLDPLLSALRSAAPLRIASLFSHFAASEDPAHDAFSREQIARFTHAADRITEVLGYRPLRHMANSGGITRFPEAHFDLVRPGIGLHGIGVDARETAKLRPAARLITTIAQIREVPAGDSIGYGRSFRANVPLRVAVLPIGYADGLFRRLGNGVGKVWIDGKPAPFTGTICMDMCMVDVTGIRCSVGDRVVVFDHDHPVSDYAKALGTIPYEALTAISQRVKRVFTHG